MTFLPVVQRELLVGARRPSTFWTRLVFAGVAVLIAAIALVLARTVAPGGAAGAGAFRVMVWLATAYCLLSGVLLTADALSAEKREGTMGLLFLTDLRGYDVVLGKLAGAGLNALYGLMAILPVFATVLLVGGVTGAEFWRAVFVLLNTLFLSLALGLLVSSVAVDDQKASAAALLLVGGLSATGPLLAVAFGKVPLVVALTRVSPMGAQWAAADRTYGAQPGDYWASVAALHGLAWLGLVLACFLLPRFWQDRTERKPVRVPAWLQGPPLCDKSAEPVAWLVERTLAWGRRGLWLAVLGSGAILAGFDVVLGNLRNGHFLLLAWGLSLGLRILMAVQATRFFVQARRAGTLEPLFCTPLTSTAILRGQWGALRRHFMAPVLLVLVIHLLPLLLAAWGFFGRGLGFPADLFGAAFLAFSGVTFLIDMLTAGWVGMLAGLVVRRPAWAGAWAVFFAVLLPYATLCVPRVLVDLPLIAACSDRLKRELRRLAERSSQPPPPRRTLWSRPAGPPPLPLRPGP